MSSPLAKENQERQMKPFTQTWEVPALGSTLTWFWFCWRLPRFQEHPSQCPWEAKGGGGWLTEGMWSLGGESRSLLLVVPPAGSQHHGGPRTIIFSTLHVGNPTPRMRQVKRRVGGHPASKWQSQDQREGFRLLAWELFFHTSHSAPSKAHAPETLT